MHLNIEKVSWLRLATDDGIWLQDAGRVTDIIQGMTNPESQYPRLIHFIGRQSKDQAIRALFPESISRRASTSNLANLRVVPSTTGSSSPLLFADSDPFVETLDDAPSLDPELPSFEATWSATSNREVINILHARLFFLFSDVICIFVEDFPDLREVAVRLVERGRIAHTSSLPSEVRPQVIIVFPNSVCSQPLVEDYVSGNDRNEILNAFTLAPPFFLTQGDLRFSQLKNALLSHVQDIHNARRQHGSLFSCNHFVAFSSRALEHVAQTAIHPFDFITATRQSNEVGKDYIDHVSNFLRLGSKFSIPYIHLASFIASSILMDAYPPNMHCKSHLCHSLRPFA
jgi:hypothetical protein